MRCAVVLVGEEHLIAGVSTSLDRAGLKADVALHEQAAAVVTKVRPLAVALCGESLTHELAARVRSVRQEARPVPAIAVARTVERWGLRTVLAAGAAGVLVDDETLPERIGPCLRAVATGQVCVPLSLRAQIAPAALSAREKQILGLVVMGYMNCEIAERLFLAESTVKSHLSSAFGKLGVRSRNEAAKLILDPEGGLGTGILTLSGEPRRTYAPPPEVPLT